MDRKRKIDLVFGAVALLFVLFVGWVAWRTDWGKTAGFWFAAIGPGGMFFSPVLVKWGLQPWQGFVLQLTVGGLGCLAYAWKGKGRWKRRLAAPLSVALLAGAAWWWVGHRDVVTWKSAEGFPVARFTKIDGQGERSLVFIGETHYADLEYYTAMDGVVAELTAEGHRFLYEAAPPITACRGVGHIDLNVYDRDWGMYLVDTMRSPYVLPSAEWLSGWHKADLDRDDPRIAEIAKARTGDDCVEGLIDLRDEIIPDAIDSSPERRLAAHYGSSHLYKAVDTLAAKGWTLKSIEILPAGRKAPTPD